MKVFENLENTLQWVDDNGVRIPNDEPVIRDALLSELRLILCADQTPFSVAIAGSGADCDAGREVAKRTDGHRLSSYISFSGKTGQARWKGGLRTAFSVLNLMSRCRPTAAGDCHASESYEGPQRILA